MKATARTKYTDRTTATQASRIVSMPRIYTQANRSA